MKKTVWAAIFLLLTLAVAGRVYADSDAQYKSALKSYYSGKYSDAVRHLNAYIAEKPDPSAYYLMGYALYKLKRFDEANEYFRDAYLVDPTFSPVKTAPGEGTRVKPRRKVVKPAEVKTAQAASARAEPPKPEPLKTAQPKTSTPAAPVTAKPAPAPAAPATTPAVTPAAPAKPSTPAPADKPAAPAKPSAPEPRPITPKGFPLKDSGGLVAIPMLMGGLFAGFTLVFLGIGLAIYLFFSFCMYRIAVKLQCPAAWTAWVPLLNLWAMVGSAGKPWWWIILLFIPVAGFFIMVYLWMCIVENLGKNKWLGLLMIVPVVNIVYLAVLAFSKDKTPEPIITELE
ncbi:MAG: tetratricopeptide repeat protein [Nitrospirae bacterium]|nr:tetratricopeptide repeat protein [Nitrospirota bacterium]